VQTVRHPIRLTEPQERFVFSKSKYPAIIGGLGSGKTAAGERRAFMLMQYEGGCDIGYYMPSYDVIKLRVMPGFVAMCLEFGLPFKVNKSDHWIEIAGLGRIIFRSYSDPERIIAYEVCHSILDELDTIPKDKAQEIWTKCNERVRGAVKWPAGHTMANVTTPNYGFAGFSYSRWGVERDNYELINAPTWSNTFLDDVDEYVAQIRENYDEVTADAFIEGKFVNFSANKVYHSFDRTKNHTDRTIQEGDSLHVSIDFNVGGCCATTNVIDNKISHTVAEFTSNNTRDFINKMARYKDHQITVYPDATGNSERTNASASDIDLIKQAGYRVDAPNKNPFVKDRVNAVNGGFSHARSLINTTECPKLTEALESQGYDTKGKPEKFDQHPSIDDWTDSYGYYYNRRFPIRKPAIVSNIRMAV